MAYIPDVIPPDELARLVKGGAPRPPHIFSGTKISITLAVIGVIVAEFVASHQGIGYLIVFANGLHR